jgi:hypothetical protein
MSLLSVVTYLWTLQHDWQISRDVFDDLERFTFLSQSDDRKQCTKITSAYLEDQMIKAGNTFAGAKLQGMPFDYMCLPPNSTLTLDAEKVAIKTPFCAIVFGVDQMPIEWDNRKPEAINMDMMADGHPRYTTRVGLIRASIKYDWLRAQSRLIPKYQTWANDVLDRAGKWFATEIDGKNYIKSGFEE